MTRNLILAYFLLALVLGACNTGNTGSTRIEKGKEVVHVYTQRHYASDDQLFKRFEEETGIEVKLVKASADQLLERIKMEGANSPADLLISVDAGRLWRAKEAGYLQTIKDKEVLALVDPLFIDKDSSWVALTYRSRVFVVNKDSIDNYDLLKNYKGLTDAKFKGEVLVRSSENLYNQSLLASIIAHEGEEAALKWAEGVVQNMAREPKGNDSDQLKNVAAGIGDLALVNTYYLARLMASNQAEDKAIASKLRLVFPDEGGFGAHVNISGVGLLKHAKNKENAIKLMRFLCGEEAQHLFMTSNNEYPVNPRAEWTDILKEIGNFKKDDLDLNKLGEYNSLAVKVLDKAEWH